MKLEYLHSGSDDCPLIRIYQGTTEEHQTLLNAIDRLLNKEITSFYLDKLPDFVPIDNIQLEFILSIYPFEEYNVANKSFSYGLTKEGLQKMKELIIPFLTASPYQVYQWIYEDSDIVLLLSADGQW
ncbi:hypothetical protein ACFGVR_16595 [Mucilaginibacter sp. AW1-3]